MINPFVANEPRKIVVHNRAPPLIEGFIIGIHRAVTQIRKLERTRAFLFYGFE